MRSPLSLSHLAAAETFYKKIAIRGDGKSPDQKVIDMQLQAANLVYTEFSETPNQAYFYANFWFCTRTFPAGDSKLRQVFFC